MYPPFASLCGCCHSCYCPAFFLFSSWPICLSFFLSLPPSSSLCALCNGIDPAAVLSFMPSSISGDRPSRRPCTIGEASLGGGSLSQGRGDWQTTCLSILKKVEDQLGQSASIFNAPVDVKLYPEYPKYVDKPMDLGTVRGRLDKGIYRDPQEFCNVRALCTLPAHEPCLDIAVSQAGWTRPQGSSLQGVKVQRGTCLAPHLLEDRVPTLPVAHRPQPHYASPQ